MDICHEIVRHGVPDVLVVRLTGPIDPGSRGNSDAARATQYITEQLNDRHAALIVDLTGLEYVWGNYVGGWLVPAIRLRLPVRIAAVGPTAKALMGLLASSGLEAVTGDPMTHPTVAAALDSLP